MTYSLQCHNKGYQVSFKDVAVSLATGFSGASYAYRHYELGHRLVALVEMVPVLGGIVALIERVVHAIFCPSYSPIPWRKTLLSLSEAVAEANNAFYQNLSAKQETLGYASFSEATSSIGSKIEPLTFRVETSEDIGPRSAMEDAKFVKETEDYLLAGVFDGHGGSEVSNYAGKEFEKRFPEALKEVDSPCIALEKVFHEIHQDIVKSSSWNSAGSTAVVTYVDKSTNMVYTATIGDSEANIYRKFGRVWSSIKSIPLSVVQDWTSPSERARLENYYGKDRVQAHINQVGNPKGVRSRIEYGVNTARALGDVDETGTPSKPLVIHKPEITVTRLNKGDALVLACDGLKDYVPEDKIAEVVKSKPEDLADRLVKTAKEYKTQDNVTVVAIHC